MTPRDLPAVVADLLIEMHEVRSESKALNSRIDRLGQRMQGAEAAVKLVHQKVGLLREENRQNTDRFIDAFSRSVAPLVDRALNHERRLNNLENPQQ